ncbi:MAG: acetyl-CoA carboxylase carboxyl transferase subunit alpha, partial [Candidatus Marinimicrobia bacterium]|nr:acetyl-CoA carboxylase carboxyl transferase subunit alpha [Candidatus Neomarinimicrobiota bacterium]
GGAHRDFNASANELKTALQEELKQLCIINPDDFLDNRIEKYDKLGYFQESI